MFLKHTPLSKTIETDHLASMFFRAVYNDNLVYTPISHNTKPLRGELYNTDYLITVAPV